MKMRDLNPILFGVILLAVMVTLFIKTIEVQKININHADVLAHLTQLRDNDEEVDGQVLKIRYRQLHNFDLLRNIQTQFAVNIDDLQNPDLGVFQSGNSEFDFLLRRLDQDYGRKWLLLEHYLTDSAVLKNSLSYFSSSRLRRSGVLPSADDLTEAERQTVLHDLHRVQRDILVYGNNGGDELLPSVIASATNIFNALPHMSEAAREKSERLLKHVDILISNRGSLDRLIQQMEAIDTASTIQKLTDLYLRHHETEEEIADKYQFGFLFFSALLLFYLIYILVAFRRATNAVSQEKEMVSIALGSIGDGVITTDTRNLITFFNSAAERLTGWTSEEALGKPLGDHLPLISDVTRAEVESPALRCIAEARRLTFSEHFLFTDKKKKFHRVDLSATPLLDDEGDELGSVLVFRDISRPDELEQKLTYQLQHDQLTGLYNRNSFELRLVESLASAVQNEATHTFCILNLDHFKLINDTCGNSAGDRLLKQVGSMLQQSQVDRGTVARLGSDEFAVLLDDLDPNEGLDYACQLREQINAIKFEEDNRIYDTDVTIGVVFITAQMESVSNILSAAHAAIEGARASGRNRIHVYQENDTEQSASRGVMQWVPIIRKALTQNNYDLYLQPIQPAMSVDQPPTHFEVLVRMNTEERGLVPPGVFIPAAERYSLMAQIDRWVIENTFRTHAVELVDYPLHAERIYSINLSGASVSDSYFLDFIRSAVREHKLDPKHFCFEITETATIANLKSALYFIGELRAMGFQFAIDDFGSGLSSFSYIRNIPVNQLKIDGSFVRDLASNPISQAIVESVQQISRVIDAKTVAEFVENDEILARLQIIGVDYVQGYGIDHPHPWTHYREVTNLRSTSPA